MTSREHEVLPRKSENRLFQFFTSRSRSRSKARSQSTDPSMTTPAPPLPVPGPSSHARHTSLDDYDTTRYPPFVTTNPKTYANLNAGASGSRPVTRSQSRPLSTTTTATHSTITSLVTPTQRRPMPKKYGTGRRSIGRPPSASSSVDMPLDTHLNGNNSPYASPPSSSQHHSPRSETTPQGSFSSTASKPPTSTRLRLHNLFGIPLSSSRRSSLGSRATTPNSNASGPSSTPPPVPSKGRYADIRSSQVHRPSSSDLRRATSPLNDTHTRIQDNAAKEKEKRRSATAPASWLTPRFFSGSGSTMDHSRRSCSSRSPSPPPRAPQLVAVNPDSTSSLHTQTTHTHASSGEIDRDRGIGGPIHAPTRDDVPPVPQIMHTPPTPQKGNGSERGSVADSIQRRRSLASPRNSSHAGHGRNRSLVVVGESSLDGLMAGMANNSGPGNNQGVASTSEVGEGHNDPVTIDQGAVPRRGRWSPRFFGGDSNRSRGKEKEKDIEKEREREKAQAKLVASSRVGSPADGRTTPSTINGNAPRNTRSKHGSFDFESSRPMSSSSSKHTTVGIRGGRVVGITSPSMTKGKNYSRDGSSTTDANGSAKLERSVSFSDTHIKHKRSHNRDAQEPSMSLRTTLRALAETEPVPPIPSQPGTLAHPTRKTSVPPPGANIVSSWGPATTIAQTPTIGGNSKKRVIGLGLTHGSFPFEPAVSPSTSPCASEFGVIRSGDSGYGESSTTTASTSNGIINQRRGKGRSLDLNLGLSWAPNKVKPEAIMTSFGSKGKERREREREEERRKFENGVNEAFKDILGEAGYARFRKYIRRFDTQDIPFDGPRGLVPRVEGLLDAAPPPRLQEQEKRELLDRFIKVVVHSADTR